MTIMIVKGRGGPENNNGDFDQDWVVDYNYNDIWRWLNTKSRSVFDYINNIIRLISTQNTLWWCDYVFIWAIWIIWEWMQNISR